MNLNYPYGLDNSGRTGATDGASHIRQLIEQVLFTMPGERVNRPDFGSGVMQLVFAPNSNELAATTQFLVQSALQQWLGDWIAVEAVHVSNEDATLRVTIEYSNRQTQERSIAEFSRGGPTL